MSTAVSQNANSSFWRDLLHISIKILWAVFFLVLPVTSFPFFPPSIGGGAVVRPLLLYPLILLTFLAIIPKLFTKPISKTILNLLPFTIIAIGSTLLSLTRGIEPFLNISLNERTTRGVLTLIIGILIYLAVTILPESFEDLKFSLKWLYGGMSIAFIWASLQVFYVIQFNSSWYNKLNSMQSFISTRRLIENRISGFAYEPNWFAEQITFLLLPWLFTSVLSNISVFKWRWHRITIEWFLLVWSILLIPFSYSRAGLLNLILLTGFSLFFFRLQSLSKNDKKNNQPYSKKLRKIRIIGRIMIEAILILSLLSVPIYLVGSKNAFFGRVWNYWKQPNISLAGYLDYLGFGARLTYSKAAINVYKAHPFMGVGLGNYVFYFEDNLPFTPMAESPEILRLITPEPGRNRLTTTKNFFLRLLSETGTIGTSAFIAFLVAIIGCALFLWLSPFADERFWGIASIIGFVSFLLSSLTFDSFALPNMWVVFGFITAAAWLALTSKEQKHTQPDNYQDHSKINVSS